MERWLKAAFRAMPFTPIYAPRGNTLQAATPEVPDATFDIVAFSGTVLGDKSDDRAKVAEIAASWLNRGGETEPGSTEHNLLRLGDG
ncbi:hypothetical protein [Methylorubrum extorquens]|uniref:Uncharacterized protein n=1 Tax=Methylorubrum extorquens TaxID=408 RepID=A0AAX3WPC2_METEX|nr:hypothetical protein [Methylorubrum extorquens]WHQ72545.1 hypothetical protein KEC54_13820 [Methylorubrum extorquens]